MSWDIVQFDGLQGDFYAMDAFWQSRVNGLEAGESIYWSHLEPVKPEHIPDDSVLFFVPRYTGSSDYSGSLIERANCKVILESACGCVHPVYGGYGSQDIAIVCKAIGECDKPEAHQEVLDILKGLEDYPLASDDVHGELEMEAIEEGWNNWASSDFAQEIERGLTAEGIDDVDSSDLDLRELFEEAREEANVYWENECGDSMHVDIGRVVKAVDFQALADSLEDPEHGVKTFRRLEREALQDKVWSNRKQAIWNTFMDNLPDFDPDKRLDFLQRMVVELEAINEEKQDREA